MGRLHHEDFYGWTQDQADALRRRSVNEIDWDNLLAEIEDLGRSERRELRSRLALIIQHVLKWRFQPLKRTRSWALTLAEQRAQVRDILQENPSLKAELEDVTEKAFRSGLNAAADETGLSEAVLKSNGAVSFDDAMTASADWMEPEA
jgi:hypothetical protein